MDSSTVALGVLSDLPIAREATTSRVLVNNEHLRTVVFSFDAGQVLTEHASPRAVVVQLLDGRLSFTVAGEEHEMHPGDVIYLAPNERHALEALEPSHMSLVMVDVDVA
ncbi:cupin domain-containing protein [Corynebacterium sp. TAE3-ERU30]|uniref:cupin domain-containing protein n=1 Tax=Corynebacterium sp. TAE3-ERU30 TaxID=2849496 RepID=UPI001C44CCC9|nr:cupin domain-containing protein [Corynebacterium sp. TAE3-ERU30]MBV7282650.1 cupin domain-containing protein [Corynebacterium sp. TAE3-ERU30]